MPSRAAETCIVGGGPVLKLREVGSGGFHLCASESTDRFSESANLMVNMGLTLQKG